jgi:hypothetical protein
LDGGSNPPSSTKKTKKVLDLYRFYVVYSSMRKTLNTKQIKELNRKLSLPEVRTGPRRELVPPKLTQAEWNYLVFVSLAKVREANGNSFGKKLK